MAEKRANYRPKASGTAYEPPRVLKIVEIAGPSDSRTFSEQCVVNVPETETGQQDSAEVLRKACSCHAVCACQGVLSEPGLSSTDPPADTQAAGRQSRVYLPIAARPRRPTPTRTPRPCTCDPVCTCNPVCTCDPVCTCNPQTYSHCTCHPHSVTYYYCVCNPQIYWY